MRKKVWRSFLHGTALFTFAAVICDSRYAAAAGHVADVIKDLYTEDNSPGITLARMFGHQAHFLEASASALDQLNRNVLGNVGLLGLNSASTSVTYDIEAGVPVRTAESLGPLIAERADTLGAHRFNFGFSFTHINYNEFDGQNIDNLGLTLHHEDCCHANLNFKNKLFATPDQRITGFETDVVKVNINLNVSQDVYAFYGTYGVTDRFDVGVVVPVIHSEAAARGKAGIFTASGTPGGSIFPSAGAPFHTFVNAPDTPISKRKRSATDVGDVLLRAKYNFLKQQGAWPDMAVAGTLTLPTGNSDDLAGSVRPDSRDYTLYLSPSGGSRLISTWAMRHFPAEALTVTCE